MGVATEKQWANTLRRWARRYSFAPFVIGVVFASGLMIYISFLRPLDNKFTSEIRGSYICQNLAALIALLTGFFAARNRWVSLGMIVAIDLFIFGMLLQLLSFLK